MTSLPFVWQRTQRHKPDNSRNQWHTVPMPAAHELSVPTRVPAVATAMGKRSRLFALFMAVLALSAQSVFAQTQYFRIGGGGAWNSPTQWSLSSGGAAANAVPGAGDIAIFDNLSGSPIISLTAPITVGQLVAQNGGIVRFNSAAAQTLTVQGIAVSSTAPLFVNANSEMRILGTVTLQVNNGGAAAANGASIFGKIAVEGTTVLLQGTIVNNSAKPFSVESGGTLEMAGGTYTNMAGTIVYAITGTRGTLAYTRPDNNLVTIPAPGVGEIPAAGVPLGNLYINRNSFNAPTLFTGGPPAAATAYVLRGTLTVERSILTLCNQGIPEAVNLTLAASRMIGGGKIQGNAFSVMTYQDDPVNPLNPATSDLDFVNTPGLFTFQNDSQGLYGLTNSIRTLNLTLNSDVNIYGNIAGGGGFQILSLMAPTAGQVTIAAMRTLSLRPTSTSQIQGDNNGRVNVSGILSISTNATLNNLNMAGSNPLAGVVVNTGGRVRIWGGDANAGTMGIIGPGRSFYADATATLEYTDRGDGTTNALVATTALFSQTPKLANRAELPELMRGRLVINRTSQRAQDNTSALALTASDGVYVSLPAVPTHPAPAGPSTTQLVGPLDLQQGVLNLNGTQLIADGTVTSTAGGAISGNDMLGGTNTDALVYRATNAGTMRVTSATIAAITSGRNFNYIEIGGSGNLGMGGTFSIDGDAGVQSYGLAGTSNYNGQLRFTGLGNLVMNSSDMTFSGNGAANTTIAAQAGHIPVTTATSGAILSDAGANITFNSVGARSYPRFTAGGQVVNNFTIGDAALAPAVLDYLVSLRTPLTVNGILLLRSNAVLQLWQGGDLTYKNANIQFFNPATPQFYGNLIDASQGGRLTVTAVPTGSFFVPVGVGSSQVPYAAGNPPLLRRATIDNTLGAFGDSYTVTVTTAIVNLVAALPNLTARSMRGQWNITRNGGAPLTGNITLDWTPDLYVPATGFGSEPNGANEFQPRMIANPILTSMRRWNGTSYVNVLPVTTPLPAVVTVAAPPLRSITAVHSGALSNTPFIISNELFPIYWVGGSNSDWAVNAHWASTSGGTPGSASVPGINDFPVFDRGVTTTIRTNIPSLTRTAPANAIQKLAIVQNSNVTFAPTDIPTTLELVQNAADDNLFVEQGSRLALGDNTGGLLQPMTLRIPDMTGTTPVIALTNAPSAAILGTLALQTTGSMEYLNAQANNMFLVANGASLNMSGGTFLKAAGALLQYGQNTRSDRGPAAPFYGINALNAYANATVMYTATGGGPQTVTPAATNELPMTPLNARLVINRPTATATVRINATPYQISSSVTVQSGILDLSGNIFQVGFGTYPATGNHPNLDRALTVATNGLLRGNLTTVLALNGMGQGTLRFEPATSINTLRIEDLSTTATLAGVSTTLLTDLSTQDLQVVAGTRVIAPPAYGVPYALNVSNGRTLRLNSAAMNNITVGRVLAGGTIQVTGGALVRLPDLFANGGLDVSTTGTLNIFDGTAGAINTATAAPAAPGLPTNIVRYLDRASTLLLTNNPATGGGLKGLNSVEMPYVFAGTLVVNKTGAVPANNMVQIDFCRAVTAGTLSLVAGFFDMNNFALKIGGVLNPATAGLTPPPFIYAYSDVLNGISPTASLSISSLANSVAAIIPFNTTPLVDNSASIIYNSNANANLVLKQQVGADMPYVDPVDATLMYPAIALNKIENNGTGTLTLGTNTVVRIDGSAGLPACETPFGNAGQLRLVDNTGSIRLNASRLVFTGNAGTGGQLITSSTSGSVIGDVQPTTSLRFASLRPHVMKAGTGTGAQFNNIQVEPLAPGLLNPNTYVRMTNSVTVQDFLLRRSIVSVTSPTITVTITNSTTGNITGGQANFGEPNGNFFDCSGGGKIAMPIAAGATKMFPVAAWDARSPRLLIRMAPVMIVNGGTADTYTVGVDTSITNQKLVYPSRVDVEWSIVRSSGVGANQSINLGWHTDHETLPPIGLVRGQSFPAQWAGSAYTAFPNEVNDPTFPGTTPPLVQQGPMWTQNVPARSASLPSVTYSALQPWVVISPPIASQLAADSLNPALFNGFNNGNANFFQPTAGGSLTVTSGVPFPVHVSAFNGFNQPTAVNPVTLPGGFTVAVSAAGGDAVFNITNPTGQITAGTNPVGRLNVLGGFQIDWLNPLNRTSTTAVITFPNALSLASVPLTITILAPQANAVRIAFNTSDGYAGASTATFGFNTATYNNITLSTTSNLPYMQNLGGRLNIRGGVPFPVLFGLYGADDLLKGRNLLEDTARTYVLSVTNPVSVALPSGYSSIFSTTTTVGAPFPTATSLALPGYAGTAVPSIPTAYSTLPYNAGLASSTQKTGAMLSTINWVGWDRNFTTFGGVANGPIDYVLDANSPTGRLRPVGATTAVITLSSYKTFRSREYFGNPNKLGGVTGPGPALVDFTPFQDLDIISTSVTVQLSGNLGTPPQPTQLGLSTISGALSARSMRTLAEVFPAVGANFPDSVGVYGFNTNVDGFTAHTGFPDCPVCPAKPIRSGDRVPIWVSTFADDGSISPAPPGTSIQVGILAHPLNPGNLFAADIENIASVVSTTGSVLIRPRFQRLNSPANGDTVLAIVRVVQISGAVVLRSTEVTIMISSTSTLPYRLAFNRQSWPLTDSAGAAGIVTSATVRAATTAIPIPQIQAGRPFDINFGLYGIDKNNAFGIGVVAVSVAADPSNPAEVFNMSGVLEQQVSGGSGARLSGAIINWPTIGAAPRLATLTLYTGNWFANQALVSTTITVTIVPPSANASSLAFSATNVVGTDGLPPGGVLASSQFNARVGLFSESGTPITSLINMFVRLNVQGLDGNTFVLDPIITQPVLLLNQQSVLIPTRIYWTAASNPLSQTNGRVRIIATPVDALGVPIPNIAPVAATMSISTTGTAPVILDFNPKAGPIGTTVSITGFNFNNVNAVTIGGAIAQIIAVTPGGVTAIVSNGAVTGPVTVSAPGTPTSAGGSATSTVNFTVLPLGGPATITGFTPNQGSGGTRVTITGVSLGMASSVTVAGIPATIVPGSNTNNQLIVITGPSATTLSGPIVVVTPQGSPTSTQLYRYTLAPSITNITPNAWIANGTDRFLTINGSNFSVNAGGDEGLFIEENGVVFGFAVVATTRTGNQITFRYPGQLNLRPGVRRITVRNGDGQLASVDVTLQPNPTPVIRATIPPVTTATGTAYPVAIAGSNFFAPVGVTVSVNGTQITTPLSVSPTLDTVRFEMPVSFNNTAGTLNIVIRNADGQSVTGQIRVNEAPTPVITSITPNPVLVGAPTQQVTLNGTGFFYNAVVQVDNVVFSPANNNVVLISPTRIVLTVPATLFTTPRGLPVRVRNADGKEGTGTLNVSRGTPTIANILPATSASVNAFIMTINGTNFRTGARVTMTSQPPAVASDSLVVLQVTATQILARVPASRNRTGLYFVTVTNTDDQGSATANFSIGRSTTPEILRIDPPVPPADGSAFAITIYGRNFISPPTQANVTFRGTPITGTVINDSTIVAFVPAGANTTRTPPPVVVVTNPDGQFVSFTYTTVSVKVSNPIEGKLYPNPVSEGFSVQADIKHVATVRMRLTDALGRTVLEFREQVTPGVFRKEFNVSSLPAGVYVFEMFDGERRFIEKVIKQ